MHFAKLFTYPDGQLLVTVNDADDLEHAAAPYQLVTETRSRGISMVMAGGFSSKKRRDSQFAAMDEAKALTFYNKQQAVLRNAGA